MGGPLGRTSSAKISMYLRSSQLWWAYLGIKSNPSALSRIDDRYDRAIFFDDPSLLPPGRAGSRPRNIYFYICWDGLSDESAIEKVSSLVGRDTDLNVLVVGDFSRVSREKYTIESLYPEGVLSFSEPALHFDSRTTALLLGARIKNATVPLKNLSQKKGSFLDAIKLLLGKKQVVFCGSFGISPPLIKMLCERHSIDFGLFEQYQFYCKDPNQSLETYRSYLRIDGMFLADLYQRSQIDATSFLATIHLLGREYFIEKIRASGLDVYANRFAGGSYVDVYSTPFYSQHIFLDFGSVVGTGGYPRLADLTYFKKKMVAISLHAEIEQLLARAHSGSLDLHFDQEWDLKSPQIIELMK